MAKDGILHRLEDDPGDRACAFDVFDRAAFEGRLKEARARRAIALASKPAPAPRASEGFASHPRRADVEPEDVLVDIESAIGKDDSEHPVRGSFWADEPESLTHRLLSPVAWAIPARGSLTLLVGMFVAGLGLGSWATLLVTQNKQAPVIQANAAPVAVVPPPMTRPTVVVDREPWVPAASIMIETPTPNVSARPVLTAVALPAAPPTPSLKGPETRPAEPVVAEETPLARSLAGRPYPRPAAGPGDGTDPTKGALELRRESDAPAATETASAEQILDALREQSPNN